MTLPEKTIWDDIVQDHEHVWDNVNAVGREAMAGFIESGESVLDVGCGNGFVYRSAIKNGDYPSRYVGIDLSKKFIEAANKLSPEADWRQMDAENLEFADNEFDTVIIMHVLECLNGYEKAVMEALRVAKSKVIVCFWKQFAEETQIQPTEPYGFESVYSKEDWFNFLEKIGMPITPWLEVHAEADRSNLFFVLEKENLNTVIAKEAPSEVKQAIDNNEPPNQYTEVKRDVEQHNITWNPPITTDTQGPQITSPGKVEEQPEQEEKSLKGLHNKGVLQEVVVDSDDLCDEHDPYDFLFKFKEEFPKFKITLFAIPNKCSEELLQKYNNLNWVELAVHGYSHEPNTEFQELSYEDVDMRMMAGVAKMNNRNVSVFKAPGWQISIPALQWMKDNDWIVIDQYYNNDKRPERLKTLVYADEPTESAYPNMVHTHTFDCCGNSIEDVLSDPWMIDENTEFKFVSEVAKPWSKDSN